MADTIKTGSLCPALKAAEVVGDKWILLILREMFLGTTRYGQFERAIPRISPSVLSGRLKQMESVGLIIKRTPQGAKTAEYRLTRSGKEFLPVIDQLSRWGMRWAKRQLEDEDVDIAAFMWDFHRSLNVEELSDGTTVICVQITDAAALGKWWIIVGEAEVDLCTEDPGHDVHVFVSAKLDDLISVWMGHADVRSTLESGAINLTGDPHLERSAVRWFPRSLYADVSPEPDGAVDAG